MAEQVDVQEWVAANLPTKGESVTDYFGRFKLINGSKVSKTEVKNTVLGLGYVTRVIGGKQYYALDKLDDTICNIFNWIAMNSQKLGDNPYEKYVVDHPDEASAEQFAACIKVAGYQSRVVASSSRTHRTVFGSSQPARTFGSQSSVTMWEKSVLLPTKELVQQALSSGRRNVIYIIQLSDGFADVLKRKSDPNPIKDLQYHAYKYGKSVDVSTRLCDYVGSEWRIVNIIPTKDKDLSAVESELKRHASEAGEYMSYINLEELILTADIGKYIDYVKKIVG